MHTTIRDELDGTIRYLRSLKGEMPDLYGRSYRSLGDLLDHARSDLDVVRAALAKAVVEPKSTADTLAELIESYVGAATCTGSYTGATAKQAAYLARLHWAEGERRLWVGELTRRECSAMIGAAVRN